MEGDIMSKV